MSTVPPETPRLYADLAPWWPLLSAPADYAEEAAFYAEQLITASREPPRALLEIGSGGGNNASHMKAHFETVVLVDPSAGMLDVSRRLNPECEHVLGDMRTLRLGRQFDCVFIHDAIVYMTDEAELLRALETAFLHCRPGGVALFAPDHVVETYRPSTDCGGHDGPHEALRYLEWTWDPDPSDTACTVDYVYALRSADGSVHTVHDRHVEGLFPRATWLRLLERAGFAQTRGVRFDHSEIEPGTYELFIARRP